MSVQRLWLRQADPTLAIDTAEGGFVFCPRCGKQVRDGGRFCPACGSPMESAASTSDTPIQAPPAVPAASSSPVRPVRHTRHVGRWIALGVIGVLVCGAGAVWVLYQQGLFDQHQSSAGAASSASSSSSGTASATDTVADSATAPVPPTGMPEDITGARTAIKASGSKKGYPTSNLIDNRLDSAWAENAKGYGEGQTITFTFASEVWVDSLKVVPGYVKFDAKANVDRWYSNGRVASAQMVFSDGSKSKVFLLNTDDKNWQEMLLPKPVRTSSVTFVIVSTSPANTGTVHDAEDTSIAELRVMGFNH